MTPENIQPPNNLTQREYQEIAIDSAIHPALIAANFKHIEGELVYSYLFFSDQIPRTNPGRITSGFLKRYQHVESGGWWVNGLDPHNNWEPMLWGRFKPTQPRIDEKGRPVKYESPPKTSNRVTYFDLPCCIWDLVAQRYNIKRVEGRRQRAGGRGQEAEGLRGCTLRVSDRRGTEEKKTEGRGLKAVRFASPIGEEQRGCTHKALSQTGDEGKRTSPLLEYELLSAQNALPDSEAATYSFWEWVQKHPEVPVILCEGEKKAAALLSLGFVAVALPGIWNGRVGKKGLDERLHPDLLPLAQPNRQFIILFDYEEKPKTQWAVFQASLRTGNTIEAAGSLCKVGQLPGIDKGVDDFIAARGGDASGLLEDIFDKALPLKDYQRTFHISHRGLSKKYPPDIRVNVKYLSEALVLPDEGLVALDSDMGTGKTEMLSKWRDKHPNERFLNNGHRVNLLKNLAERLKTEMYSDLGYSGLAQAKALSITIDSLHKLHTDALNYGCVFIDEACQYLTHLLHSKTCKQQRSQILEVLEYIVYNTPLVVIADAHMDDVTVDFFRAMRPQEEKPLIFVNDWKNGDRSIFWYEGNNSSAIVAQVSAALMRGEKIMVASDSKRFIKKLEKSLTMSVEVVCEEAEGRGQEAEEAGGEEKLTLTACNQSQVPSLHGGVTTEPAECKAQNSEQSPSQKVIKSSHLELQTLELQSNEVENSNSNSNSNSDINSIGNSNNRSNPNSNPNSHSSTPPLPHSPSAPSAPSHSQTPLKIWAIHSENSGSEENVAFIKDISNSVMGVDGLLASPSLGTGVDIPNYHFDAVYGVFHGASQTATECAQQLYRYRPKVPIHVWVAPRPPFGYKETDVNKIKESILQTNEVTAFLLRIDRETGKRGVEKEWALDAYCRIQAQRDRSINNLRADLHSLLAEMGNKIIPMGADDDYLAQENMRNAASVIDTNYYAYIAGAEDISYREYNQRQSKDYLQPDQVYECEKYRIKTAYGMEVTEELVAKDKGGKLNRQIAALEAVILEPEGTITDPKTGKIFPLPPTVVAEKDRQERLRLPLSMDWGNYSAQWLARSNLGLADILRRLIDGEEITSQDPDLVQMRENALYCAAHVKAILGFKIPSKCKPMWLLGTLLNQLGLKLDSRKVGPKGKQVKHFRLRAEELDFALAVIKHRRNKRDLQLHRAVQIVEEGKRHQAGMESQYGIDPPPEPVSTPPPNGIGNPQWAGVNTTGNNTSENNQVNLDKNNNSSHLNLSHIHEISQDWEPLDGDNTPIANSLKMLREAIIRGAEAVKATVCSWTCERRWSAVFLLEKVAEGELRKLEQMIPGFYQWLG